jgi:hypothetical protein
MKDLACLFITINVPVVFMARYVMILRGATSLRGALEGVGPENRDFLGPEMARAKQFQKTTMMALASSFLFAWDMASNSDLGTVFRLPAVLEPALWSGHCLKHGKILPIKI